MNPLSEQRPGGQPGAGREWADSLQSQAWEAFARDLDELLRTHRGKWVAYHGSQRVWVGDSEADVYRECLQRGLPADELLVDMIYPAAEVPAVFLLLSEGPLPDRPF